MALASLSPLSSSRAAAQGTLTNLALKATSVTASANVSRAGLVNDNNRTAWWSNYRGAQGYGSEDYVELGWPATCRITKCTVYWAESGDSISVPTEARLSCWNGTQWADGARMDVTAGTTSMLDNMSVETRKVRIYIKGVKSCGIREVRLMGYSNINPAELYTWPAYSSSLDYNYRRDYPNGVPKPTRFLPENNGQVGIKVKDWWAFAWGPNRNKYVTDKAIDGLLDRMNKDFGYFRDSLGWLPDKRARRGYYSTVYLYGSGLNSDPADSTALGGWQGATWYNGESWPMVNLSYYPVACFDPSFTYDAYHDNHVTDAAGQQGACVHEGIHAVFADLEGCKNSAWFQESGNTSMQADAELSRTPKKVPESMGFLSAANIVAPFMPIECYSGWLLDGSFGGPSAEGVNLFQSDGKQVCTWRNLLGGVQYGELFAHFLSVRFGAGSLPWIWRYCRDRVLSGIADSLGEAQTRRLVLEYNVKRATLEFGKWSSAVRKLLDSNWLLSIKQEWSPYKQAVAEWRATPYARMSPCDEVDSAGWYRPEVRTCPGWSGSNQVPLHVVGNVGNVVRIHFKPFDPNMVCMLAYRSKRGRVFYSQPCEGEGDVTMLLKEAPANGVVIAVVCNTDYIYTGEAQRKKHYDYRLRMLDNVYCPASSQCKWYNYSSYVNDPDFHPEATGINNVSTSNGQGSAATGFGFSLGSYVAKAGSRLSVTFKGVSRLSVQLRLRRLDGTLAYAQSFFHDGLLELPGGLRPGLYLLEGSNLGKSVCHKLLIK